MARLTREARHALLADVQRIAADADALWDDDAVLRRFVALPTHARVFDPQVMVIRGRRGTGKSMLFHAMRALGKRGLPVSALFPGVDIGKVGWVEGFAETGTSHPSIALVEQFVRDASDDELRTFWVVHLLARIAESGDAEAFFSIAEHPRNPFTSWRENRSDVKTWVRQSKGFLAGLSNLLDTWEAEGQRLDVTVFITYDHLDKIGLDDPTIRVRATRSLLSLWTSLANRYRSLRPKIFVREDLFEQSTYQSADASKLRGRSISLTWDNQHLYRALIRHMAAESEPLAEWIQQAPGAVPLTPREPFGLMPPDYLPETGEVSQRGFVEHLVGDKMGEGIKAGRPHRWIPGRLQDAHQAIAPRSLLTFIGAAAEHALREGPRATGARLLHPDELRPAIVETSRHHVDQTAEEHRVIWRLENLRGRVLLLDPDETTEALAKPRPNIADGFGHDGPWVLDELLRIGVLRRRHDGRLDIPDIYRFRFGIGRKGGVARPR